VEINLTKTGDGFRLKAIKLGVLFKQFTVKKTRR
jgi:hypothetical protein